MSDDGAPLAAKILQGELEKKNVTFHLSAKVEEITPDSVVFTDHQLEYLVNTYGADKIVMGSDYPFDMADYDPVEHIVSSGLSDEDKAKVAGLSILRALGIEG